MIHYIIQPCHCLILSYYFRDMQFKRAKTSLKQMIYLYSSKNYWQQVILHNHLNREMDVERPVMLIYSSYARDLNYSISHCI